MNTTVELETDAAAQDTFLRATQEVHKWRRRRRWTLGISGLLALFPFLLVIWHPANPTLAAHLTVDPFFFGMIGILIGTLMRPTRRNPLNTLWNSEDVQAIGPLAESTQMLLPEMSTKAVAALLRLLPRVNEQNTPHLTPYQRAGLHRLLGQVPQNTSTDVKSAAVSQTLGLAGVPVDAISNVHKIATTAAVTYDPKLAEAILYAYLYMGDSGDLRIVRRLAAPPANAQTQTVASAELQKVAAEVLPLLEERVQEEDARQISLRASEAPPAPVEELLHPAQGSLPTAPDELLRAESVAVVVNSHPAIVLPKHDNTSEAILQSRQS